MGGSGPGFVPGDDPASENMATERPESLRSVPPSASADGRSAMSVAGGTARVARHTLLSSV